MKIYMRLLMMKNLFLCHLWIIHPLSIMLILRRPRGAGADPSWHWAGGGVHPGQVGSQSQGLFMNKIIYKQNWQENDEASSDDMSFGMGQRSKYLPSTNFKRSYSYLSCLDLTALNLQVAFLAKSPTWEARRSHMHCTFLENLGHQLLLPWLEKRKEVPWLSKADGCSKSPETESLQLRNSNKNAGDATSIHPHSTTKQWSGICAKPCCNGHKQVTVIKDYCAD